MSASSSAPAIRHDVFISYSNKYDLPHAELLHSQLQARGLNVFFDAVSLRLDEPWEPQIAAALSSSLVIVLLISHAAVEAQSSAPPRTHDYLLMDHLLAAELHVRYRRRVVPVYIGHSKADGARVHPAQHPPQGHYSKCDSSLLLPPNYGERTDDAFNKRLQTLLDQLRMGSAMCSAPRLRALLLQPGCVHIDGDVNVSMQSACASIASNVAAAKGALDWRWYLNKMREMFLSCASVFRPIIRPFAFILPPLSCIAARVQVACDALGVYWRSARTRLIDPAFRGVRLSAVDPFIGFAGRANAAAASYFPSSFTRALPTARWPGALLLGLLLLASPLRRFMSAALANAVPSPAPQ